eukprot:gene4684-5131_t
MSDEEEDRSESSEGDEEESEESGSGEEEEQEQEEDEEAKERKARAVREDIALIKDVALFVSQTSKRIAQQEELLQCSDDLRDLSRQRLSSARRPSDWSGYDNLSEADRAELLERALMALSQDN